MNTISNNYYSHIPASLSLVHNYMHNKNTSSTTPSGIHVGPIDLSTSKKKLTLKERVKRLAKVRYLYYGRIRHMAKSCLLAKVLFRVVGADTTGGAEVNEALVLLN